MCSLFEEVSFSDIKISTVMLFVNLQFEALEGNLSVIKHS